MSTISNDFSELHPSFLSMHAFNEIVCGAKVIFTNNNEIITLSIDTVKSLLQIAKEYETLKTKVTKMEKEFEAIKEHLSKRTTEMAEFEELLKVPNSSSS